jgi:hypothetical protein
MQFVFAQEIPFGSWSGELNVQRNAATTYSPYKKNEGDKILTTMDGLSKEPLIFLLQLLLLGDNQLVPKCTCTGIKLFWKI